MANLAKVKETLTKHQLLKEIADVESDCWMTDLMQVMAEETLTFSQQQDRIVGMSPITPPSWHQEQFYERE